MAYDYEVKKCSRCNEHFKYKKSPQITFGFNPRFRPWDFDAQSAFKGIYCSDCTRYRDSAIKEAIRLAERNFERKKSDFIRCPRCDGNGSIGRITCPRCEGDGRIRNTAELLDRRMYTEDSRMNFEKYKEYLPSDFDKE